MPVTLFFGLLTLTPLALAVVIGVLGVTRLARAPLALALAALGALAPMVGLILLAPDIIPDQLTQIALLADPSGASTLAFAPVYRLDTIGMYCAFGVAFLVAPLLLWLAWRAAPPVTSASATDADDVSADDSATDSADDSAAADVEAPVTAGWLSGTLGRWQWSGLALALALESVALSLCFAENILWLALCWLLLVALAWGLGELGAEAGTLDWISLGAMALGPVAWLVIILLVALPAKHWRLIDITGVGGFSAWHVVALGVALACAGGAYPFLAWLRRRASFAMPAGVGAVIIGVIPAALLVGARTYSALRDTGDHWPQFALGAPPITAGILMTLLGGVSVLIAGLLALGRRDGRGLLALLALGQIGWGLIALGVGQPVSALGLVVLLATSVLGLGAALAALVAGRAVTADEEEPSAGPRVFGARLSAPSLFAWCVGVASLIGAPLFAGFAPQELISAAALTTTKLGIPLVGIAWIGDALLALALVRATALAFVQSPAEIKAIRDTQAALDNNEDDEDDEVAADDAVEDEGADEADDAAPIVAPPAISPRAQQRGALPGLPELRGDDLPGVILALLIVALGVAPEWLFALGGQAAASELLSTGALDGFIQTNAAGYGIAIGAQWLPGLAAWVAVILIVLVVLMQARATRVVRPVYLAGQSARDLAPLEGAGLNTLEADLADDADATADAALALAEPTEAWSDLQPAFASAWLTPASQWIIVDNDDEDEDADEDVESDDSEADDGDDHGASGDTDDDGRDVAVAAPAKEATHVATPAASAKSSAKTNGATPTRTTVSVNATVKTPQPMQGVTTATGANGRATPIIPAPKPTPTRPTATTATARGAAPGGKSGAPMPATTATGATSSRLAQAPAKGNAGATQGRPTPRQTQTPATPPKPAPPAKPAQAQRPAPTQVNGKPGAAQPSSPSGAKSQPKQQPKTPPKQPQGGSRKNNQRKGR